MPVAATTRSALEVFRIFRSALELIRFRTLIRRIEPRQRIGQRYELIFNFLFDINREIHHTIAQYTAAGRHLFTNRSQVAACF